MLSAHPHVLPYAISLTHWNGIIAAGGTSDDNTPVSKRHDESDVNVCITIVLPLSCLLPANYVWRSHVS
jgi:hypothetical protein